MEEWYSSGLFYGSFISIIWGFILLIRAKVRAESKVEAWLNLVFGWLMLLVWSIFFRTTGG